MEWGRLVPRKWQLHIDIEHQVRMIIRDDGFFLFYLSFISELYCFSTELLHYDFNLRVYSGCLWSFHNGDSGALATHVWHHLGFINL